MASSSPRHPRVPAPAALPVDDVDLAILELLRGDARRSVAEIARAVNLTAAPVARRIERLERDGVIVGYTAIVDAARLGREVEAFAELRVDGRAGFAEVLDQVQRIDGVVEVHSMAGDPDALVRLRVGDAGQLRAALTALRGCDHVRSTRTLIVLESWRRQAG